MPGSAHTWVDGDVATAAFLNALPRGVMGVAIASAGQSGIAASATDIAGASVTFTAVSGRHYKTVVSVPRLDQATSNGLVSVYIRDGASANLRQSMDLVGAGNTFSTHLELEESAASGSVTRKVSLSTSAGTVGYPAGWGIIIVVHDIGV